MLLEPAADRDVLRTVCGSEYHVAGSETTKLRCSYCTVRVCSTIIQGNNDRQMSSHRCDQPSDQPWIASLAIRDVHCRFSTRLRQFSHSLIFSPLDYCNSGLVGLPVSLIQRLRSVQNAVARLIYSIRRPEDIIDALISLHWLRVQERIVFKTAVLTYRALRRLSWRRVADVSTRRRVRSASTNQLTLPSYRLYTFRVKAVPTAGTRIWNSPTADVTHAPSLTVLDHVWRQYCFVTAIAPSEFFNLFDRTLSD